MRLTTQQMSQVAQNLFLQEKLKTRHTQANRWSCTSNRSIKSDLDPEKKIVSADKFKFSDIESVLREHILKGDPSKYLVQEVHEEILKIEIDQEIGSYQQYFYLNSKVAASIILGNLKYKGALLTVKTFIQIMIAHNQQASIT